MLAIGRYHLDWGSVDQSPMAPVLAALADAVAPGPMLVLRLPAILATSASVVLAALIARELGGRHRAQLFTGLAQATALWSALAGHWLTPYTLEPAQWLLLAWLVIRWTRDRDDRLLPLVGLVVGVAGQTKFQVLLSAAVLAGSLLLVGPRELLRRPLRWVGAGIALLSTQPTLYWQAAPGVAAVADGAGGCGRGGCSVRRALRCRSVADRRAGYRAHAVRELAAAARAVAAGLPVPRRHDGRAPPVLRHRWSAVLPRRCCRAARGCRCGRSAARRGERGSASGRAGSVGRSPG